MRSAVCAILSLLGTTVVYAQQAGAATPLLYVYRGAGCTGVDALPQFEAMLGRKVDGVVDFNDYTKTSDQAVANLDWQLGCWRKSGRRLAISIGLAFKDLTTAAIARGDGDAMFQRMGASLVAHGFGDADIRLGWESNGGWYGWGRQGDTYAAAFDRAARLLRGAPGAKFTIWFNPAAGMEMDREQPKAESGMALDEYANTWNSGGNVNEPGLWQGDLKGWWGFQTLGSWPNPALPTAVPELGVGSRSDGHGACPQSAPTACDDPFFLAAALEQAAKVHARFVGFWDYDAGDYNSQVSSGERPGEAAVLMLTYGSANLKAILAGAKAASSASRAPAIRCTDPSGAVACHYAVLQAGPSRWDVVLWAGASHPFVAVNWTGVTRSVDIYRPKTSTAPTRHLGGVQGAQLAFTSGDQYVLSLQQ